MAWIGGRTLAALPFVQASVLVLASSCTVSPLPQRSSDAGPDVAAPDASDASDVSDARLVSVADGNVEVFDASATCGDGHRTPGVEDCDDGNRVDTDRCTNACRFATCGDGVLATRSPLELSYRMYACAPNGPSSVVIRWNDVPIVSVPILEVSACAAFVTGSVPVPPDVVRAVRNVYTLDVPADVNLAFADFAVTDGAFDGFGTFVVVTPTGYPAGACRPTIHGPASFEGGLLPVGREECDESADSPTCHGCMTPSCGDGIVQPELGETCEFFRPDGESCNLDCTEARCGDGWIRYGVERCDDGNDDTGDGCAACDFESCGNGVVDRYELCDDGNALDDDFCIHCVPARCGDGSVQAGVEECDVPGDQVTCPDCRLPD